MSLKLVFILLAIAGLSGIAFGYFLRWIVSLGKRGSMELEIKKMLLSAKEQAQKITEEADKKAAQVLEETKKEEKEKEFQYKKTEERFVKKEELLDNRQTDIDHEVEHLKKKAEEIKEIREKQELLKAVEKKYEEDILVRMRKLELEGTEKLDRKAKDILTTSIQRLASSTASEIMATTVSIPSDDLKGKIIGKEGRNIKVFERAAGVEVIIDDTPGSIVISSFDPVRRQIARVALENLILDGRIQPAKIEEAVEKSKETINKI